MVSERESVWARRFLWAAVLLGSLFRLRQYLHARSLWIDEAMLANNILGRSFRQLLLPLDLDQTAPVPLLWLTRAFARLAGSDERVLRLLPFVCGIALLVALTRVARRLLPSRPAALAVLIAAVSPMLIYYANELKPYGLDAMWAVVLLLLALRVRELPGRRDRWVALLVVGTLATLATVPAPFMLASLGLGLVLEPEVRHAKGGWTWLVVCAAVWVTVFTAVYLALYRSTAEGAYMQRYWVPYFLSPTLPGLERKIAHIVTTGLQDWFVSEGGPWRLDAGYMLIPLILIGVFAFFRRYGWGIPVMLLLPFGLAVLASMLRRYPLAPRLMLFALPSMALLLASGVWSVCDWLRPRWRLPWFAVASACLVLLPGLDAARQWITPLDHESLRPLIADIVADHQPNAAVYVYGRAMPAWLFYTTDWSRPDLSRVHERSRLIASTGGAFYNAASRGHEVGREGDSLLFPYRDWRELVAVPSGLGPDSLGIRRGAPDPGWGANEARRIREAGGDETWLVLYSFAPGVRDSLEAAMRAAGATRTLSKEREGAVIERYVFE
jgi:hypothetical protein